MTIGMMTRSVEIAVNVGSISYRTLSHIRLGSVVVAGPPRKIASTTSSNDRRKANAAPETTEGKMAGSVTCHSVRKYPAPRLRAASSMAESVVFSAAETITITRGAATTVCAR